MNPFLYNGRNLQAEKVPLEKLARKVGTPVYVYSSTALISNFQALTRALSGTPHLICYSVKANSNLALLKLLSRRGSGFDIVSGGELHRVQKAGGDPCKTVFSGVGKTEKEMAEALRAGILLFNVESGEELERLDQVSRKMARRAPFALRVNPDVDAKTHRHIATGLKKHKFGVPFEEAVSLYEKSRRMKGVIARGLDCHIGSQMTELAPIKDALRQMAELFNHLRARGFALSYLDVGGGLGIIYRKEKPPSMAEYSRAVRKAAVQTGATILLEPGRVLAGNAGILLTRVLYRKKTKGKTWVIVDAGTNDLLRPALYEAEHEIQPVYRRAGKPVLMDVVGPLCESSDVLAGNRKMMLPEQGDLLAIMSAGAYGMSMASNYNSRPRPAEVLVEGSRFRVIRKRESYGDLLRGES
ncbi:MAG: diaminopimelate decarboxylase [candidate division Zixibacteria bacterium]|nr:diaminopimelate decarboxylase [candidate division Zixibacteria bacterium]